MGMTTVLALLALGLALGIGSSVVPGPCGIAVLASAQHSRARAVATAFGASLGDAVYAGLGDKNWAFWRKALARGAPRSRHRAGLGAHRRRSTGVCR